MRSSTPLIDKNVRLDDWGIECVSAAVGRKIELRMRRAEAKVRAVRRLCKEAAWNRLAGDIEGAIAAAGRRAGR